MNDQILTLRDLIADLRTRKPTDKHDISDILYREVADEIETLINEHLVIHVTEGLDPDDSDFIYRHVIGRRPEEMP